MPYLAENAISAKEDQQAVQHFLVVIAILRSDLLSSVVLDLGPPAAAITPMERPAIDLRLGATTDVTRHNGANEADFKVTEATEEASLKVGHCGLH